MVRGKVEVKRIENSTSRQVTFHKRRSGLLKKAHELSVLCDAEIALLIFSQKGKLFEFSSNNNLEKTIERYRKCAKQIPHGGGIDLQHHIQQLKAETACLSRKIELLQIDQRKLLGRDVNSCSSDELKDIESRLERSLSTIRARKVNLYEAQLEQLKSKERNLLEENARLYKECGVMPWTQPNQKEGVTCLSLSLSNSKTSEVETDLSIGLPKIRHSSNRHYFKNHIVIK